MRKGFIIAALLAIVAMPMAFAGVGFCRSMPCCPPHLAAHLTSIHQPDCCNTTNCDQPPAAAGEYTTAKQIHKQTIVTALVPVAIVPTTLTIGQPLATWEASPPLSPPALQRRIAILSILLI
ncbi:MAG: hypothetical protein M3P29_09840 [Acidobacteriota bacterium]|nr:hypothetical protein [Acidobacteriota bacterium]